MVVWTTGAAGDNGGAVVVVDRRGECAARDQPGPVLVDDRHHEDRPGWSGAARTGDGAQRVCGIRLLRARHVCVGLPCSDLRAAPTAILPGRGLRSCGPAAVSA